jgi:alanine dehydrogenase
VAVDQGGCIETARPTTHADPVYVVEGVIHYCVANMPGAVPHTSTLALTNATFPYVLKLANRGWRTACRADHALALGVNIVDGVVTCRGVADTFDLEYVPIDDILETAGASG